MTINVEYFMFDYAHNLTDRLNYFFKNQELHKKDIISINITGDGINSPYNAFITYEKE